MNESYAGPVVEPAGGLAVAPAVDPNNPPWGVVAGVLTWIGSFVLLVGAVNVIVLPYAGYKFKGQTMAELERFLKTDKTAVLLQILSVIPAHLLTLALIWAVVTRFGKRPFWRSLGWSWSPRFGFWRSAGLAFGLLILGILITTLLGGEKTAVDEMIASSMAARYATALLAATSGPLIEEMVYRGVLYSALQRAIGLVWAVIAVSILFTFVHVFQYHNNLAVIAVIYILSLTLTLVRAYTGRLLPCFIMHMVFNSIQSIYIVLAPYIEKPATDAQQSEAFVLVVRTLHHLL